MTRFSEAGAGDVRDALSTLTIGWTDVEPAQMFGHPAIMVHRRVVAFVLDRAVVLLRMTPAEQAELSDRFGAAPFVARNGPIVSWMEVPVTGDAEGAVGELEPYIRRAWDRARSEAS